LTAWRLNQTLTHEDTLSFVLNFCAVPDSLGDAKSCELVLLPP
jgi:hypothetical protein